VIPFGGQIGQDPHKDIVGDTWAYDVSANIWTDMQPGSGPKKNAGASMAYDAESDRVVVYGGGNEFTYNVPETWAYDYNTNTWQQMAPGPEHHLGGSLAYDAESDRIILFGGYRAVTDSLFNDTWAYDFNSNTWTEMKPVTSPSARNFCGMAYDAESDRIIMFGGYSEDQDTSAWAYDYNANTWQQMPSDSGKKPGYLDSVSMTYYAQSDRIILYGGLSEDMQAQDKTWAYDYNTNTWTEMKPGVNPGPMFMFGLTYGTAADLAILFGGMADMSFEKLSDKTWTYDFEANKWSDVTPR
jgi:N-acetylneuraminic acid mutarotase